MDTDLKQLAYNALQIARQNLLQYGTLAPVAFLVAPDQIYLVNVGTFTTTEEKQEAYQRVVSEARERSALAIITLNDALYHGPVSKEWTDRDYNGKLAEEKAAECILLTVSGPGMRTWEVRVPYARTPDGIVFGDQRESFGVLSELLAGWAEEPAPPS